METGKIKNWLDAFLGIHKTGMELMKIAHKIDSSAIPLSMINALVLAADGYVGLFLTAGLIDSLLAGAFERAFLYAGSIILTALLFGMSDTLLSGLYKKSSDRFLAGFYMMMREKAISLDYETMEQPGVADSIFRSERTAMMYGGLGNIIGVYRNMLESLFSIAMALGMTAVLCFAPPLVSSGVLAVAAYPAVSVALVSTFGCGLVLIYRKGNRIFVKKDKEIFNGHTDVELKINYLLREVQDNYKAGKVIRIYDMKEMLLANIREFLDKTLHFVGRQCDVGNQGKLFRNAVNGAFMVCVYLFVAVKVLAGAITIGAFTQYSGALAKLAQGFQNLAKDSAVLQKYCVYMTDFLNLLKMENCHAAGTIPVEKRLDGEYEIAFHNVSFHYPGSDEMVLKHVNCRIHMKGKLALVGKNGAGKTTFVKLLCRLYEPTEGMITLNGVDIRKYREEEYRELFGVVFQDFKLFAFPVWCNLAAGYERDEQRLWECLERAGAADFVRGLPDGMDTLLYKNKEGGVDISGGEAQKLALARALYKDAPFVVLDEPTAALDPVSEAQVYEGFHEMAKDKTSVYISHRMSSCRFCDDIVVFDDGKIVERGSHEELLAKKGQYSRMWNAQAKYYVT